MGRTENANLGTAVTNPATDAMALGTEVVAGAIEAGGKIVAATADMAESAARAAAAVTTGVVMIYYLEAFKDCPKELIRPLIPPFSFDSNKTKF